MKFFANINIFKKIIIVFLLISSFMFIKPEPVNASVGGTLMNPICSFMVGLGDGAMNLLHKGILRQETTLLHISEGDGWNWVQIAIAVAAIVVISIVLITGAAALTGATLMAGISVAGTMVVKTVTAGVVAALMISAADAFSDEIPLPLYSLTPDTILSGKIPLFDVNFVNPSDEVVHYNNSANNWKLLSSFQTIDEAYAKDVIKKYTGSDSILNDSNKKDVTRDGIKQYEYKSSDGQYKVREVICENEVGGYTTTQYDISQLTKTKDDEGDIPALSKQLQGSVSKWYYNLRMLAIVGMMSVLVYVGIRIVISSASDKAKYKQMLGDWLIGMLLLFTMHYIMNFSNLAVNSLTRIMNDVNKCESIHQISDVIGKKKGLIKETLDNQEIPEVGDDGEILWEYVDPSENVDKHGNGVLYWHTNLMGRVRIRTAEYKETNDDAYIGFSLMFVVLIIYTVMFTWTYLRRVVYMAFLTMIAPLVALTYPIDKMNDGSAQGFNYWFKEYIFNLLIQPLHLLIYTILISSSIKLAQENWVYSLVATGFILIAEKIMRKMFNFEKASTPGVFAGPAGAALTISGMRWLFGHGPNEKKNKEVDSGSDSSSSGNSDVKSYGNLPEVEDSMQGLIGENSEGESSGEGISRELSLNGGNSGEGGLGEENSETGNLGENNSEIGSSGEESLGEDSLGEDDSEIEDSNDVDTWKDKIGKKIAKFAAPRIRGFSNASSKYFSAQSERLKRDAKNAKPIRKLGGIALGAVGGGIALAAGIASGDPSKAAQYAGIGLAGGYKLGSSTTGAAINRLSVPGVADEYERGFLGEEEYQKKMQQKLQLEKARSEEVIKRIQEKQKISRDEAEKKAMDYAERFMSVTENVDEWIALDKMTQMNVVYNDGTISDRTYTDNEAVDAYRIRKRSGVGSKEEKKAKEQIQTNYNLGNNTNAVDTYYRTAKVLDDILNG